MDWTYKSGANGSATSLLSTYANGSDAKYNYDYDAVGVIIFCICRYFSVFLRVFFGGSNDLSEKTECGITSSLVKPKSFNALGPVT